MLQTMMHISLLALESDSTVASGWMNENLEVLWKLVLEEMLYVNYKSSIILVHKSQSLSGSSADSLAYSII